MEQVQNDSSDSSDSSDSLSVRAKSPMWASIREAFRIDFGARVSIEQLFGDASRALDEEAGGLRRRDACLDQELGFGNSVTERQILQMYSSTNLEEHGLSVVLVLKLALALLAFGQNTIDAELMLFKVSHAIGLPSPHFCLAARSLEMSVGGGPAHLLRCRADLYIDKLLDVTALCRHIAVNDGKASDAMWVLDSIIQRPEPYGWFLHLLNLECVCSWAALAAFFGTWQDMLAAALITPFALMTRHLCMRRGLANLELLLVSIVVGIVTPLVWRYIVEVPLCHVPILWACALLIYLPGCELIYGAYEIQFGSVVNGSAQLMAALVRCMIMGCGLTTGWQLFGRNAAMAATGLRSGAIASMVPAEVCMFTGPSWEFVFGVLNFPMVFHCFLSLNMRLADMLSGFVVVYPSLFAFMALVQWGGLPAYVTDAAGMFVGANLGSALERWNGTPVCITIVPMVIILAPGFPSVLSVLASMQKSLIKDEKVTSFWSDLALQGAAYAVGLSLALGIWRAWNHSHRQLNKRHGSNNGISELSQRYTAQPPPTHVRQ